MSNVWSENTALFERLMEIHFNSENYTMTKIASRLMYTLRFVGKGAVIHAYRFTASVQYHRFH